METLSRADTTPIAPGGPLRVRARVSAAFSADRNTEAPERVRARAPPPPREHTYHRVRTKPTRH